jgi:hypothetical protein
LAPTRNVAGSVTPGLNGDRFDAIYDDVATAWQIVHDWDLAVGLQQFVDNDNHRLFRDWASRYRRAASAAVG